MSTNFIKLAHYLLVKYATKENNVSNITQGQYDNAKRDVSFYQQGKDETQRRLDRANEELATARARANDPSLTEDQREASATQAANIETRTLPTLNSNLESATRNLENAQQTVSEFESQTTVPSVSETITNDKYENSEVVAASTTDQEATFGEAAANNGETTELGRTKQVPSGAIPPRPKPASVNFRSMAGEDINQDMRVKIRVPDNYLTELTQGPSNELRNLKGIIFPYTPSLSIEHKADYASQAPMHSNYAIYFYQRSSVSPINISGKFTVANEAEAAVYIATVHLLRALTKMRSGGATGDADSGSPPPVCRLDAYGAFMLQNVPVAISNFKIDLPDNVDYYTLGKRPGSLTNSMYEMTSVPVVSTISVTCIPMYSRDEMQKFNVTQWLGEDGKYVRKAGYL